MVVLDIEKSLSEGFEKDLFSASMQNLEDTENPLRLNNFSYAMRELTRHILHRLSPSDNVLKCTWYKNETEIENGISRKQRACYAVQGGLSDSYVENILGIEVNDIHRKLIKAISRLSKFTHIEPKTFNLPEDEVSRLVEDTKEAVYNFLSLIDECRQLIIDGLWDHIDSAVIDETLRETIANVDALATHHFIEEVYIDKIEIYAIDHESVRFRAGGSLGCELQWGSNSDLRRGDGAVLSQSFPFVCELISPVEQPENIETIEGSLGVDTTTWEEARYGLDEQA